jgi:hypothetical protein
MWKLQTKLNKSRFFLIILLVDGRFQILEAQIFIQIRNTVKEDKSCIDITGDY